MRVILAATGKFHFFDLARQLLRLDALDLLYTAYPLWKISPSMLPPQRLQTFPWLHSFYMGLQRYSMLSPRMVQQLDCIDRAIFDKHVATKLRPCDVFTAISGCGLESSRVARSMGASYVCDRGSTHINFQNRTLKEEHAAWGMPFTPTHSLIVERELAEYAEADLITVPSNYAKSTFISEGVDESKIAVIPYGVDLESFCPVGLPDDNQFVVVYVGGVNIRKGVQYLLPSFAKLRHPRKKLILIGHVDHGFLARLAKLHDFPDTVVIKGHVEQAELKSYLSRANVLVLPSVEDGFGLVLAQALACGCPVIASDQTGGSELIEPGVNGYIVPARDVLALSDALQKFADNDDQRAMRVAALKTADNMGGWNSYGDSVLSTYQSLCESAAC